VLAAKRAHTGPAVLATAGRLTQINPDDDNLCELLSCIYSVQKANEQERQMTERHMLDIIHDQNPVMLTAKKSVKEACELMRERRIGAILVVDDEEHLVGIFTGRDAVCRVVAEGRDSANTMLQDVMTGSPVSMAPGKTANEALHLMQDGGYRHLPVTDGNRVIGIVSKGDFRGLEQARLDSETELWERIA
jgi:CBS domain-containing protein